MNLPARAQVTYRDASGSVGYVTVHLGENVPIDTARLATQALAGLVASVQAGLSFEGYSVTYRTHLSDAPGEVGSAIEDRAVIVLSDGEGDYAVVVVPGIPVGSFEATGEPDPPPALLADLVEALAAAPYGNPFGEGTPVFVAAYGEVLP